MSSLIGGRSPLRTFGILSLRRRWKLVASCGALFLIAGLLMVVLKPARYTSTTQLLVYVKQLQPGPELVISSGSADLTQVQNEIEIVRSRGMLAKVVGALKLTDDDEIVPASTLFRALAEKIFRGPSTSADDRPRLERAIEFLEKHVAVKRVGTSHTILVSVTTSDPGKSMRIANTIGQVALQARVSAEQEGSRSPLLRERLQGLGPNAYVMTAAGAAGQPDGPRKIVVILAALLSGIIIGSALALILDLMNRTVRTAAQVEYLGLECIGAIPRLPQCLAIGDRWRASTRTIADADELRLNGMLDQTLRRALTAVTASKTRTIGITSAVAQEGAATVGEYLAQIATLSQKKVLLIEASHSELISPVGSERRPVASVFDQCSPHDGIVTDERTGFDVLRIDPAGSVNGASWRSRCGPDCLALYELVVINLPSLELGPEFRMAAKDVDGILLVIKWGSTEFDRIEQAIAASGVVPSEFVGAVLNMVDDRMIGKFGDKFWEAEAALVARRNPFEFAITAERPVG